MTDPEIGQSANKKLHVTVIKKSASAEVQAHALQYNALLIQVLREDDVVGFRNFLVKVGRALPEEMMLDTLRLESMMKQLILSIPELEDLHPTSREWLDKNTHLGSHFVGLDLEQPVLEEEKQILEHAHNENSDTKPQHRTINLHHFDL